MPPGYTAPQPVQPQAPQVQPQAPQVQPQALQVQPQALQPNMALMAQTVADTSVPSSVQPQVQVQQPEYGPNPPPLPPKPTQNGNIMNYVGPPVSTPPTPVQIESYQHIGFSNIPGTPGNVNPLPQQDPTHGGRVDEANLTIDGVNYYTQAAFDAVKQREGLGLAKSFVQAIYDEMGDALYKADPHVAGLIISRIYMDKFVR